MPASVRKSGSAAQEGVVCGWVRRYLTFMTTKVSSKGQIVLPAALREQDGIDAGQEFEVTRMEEGRYELVRKKPRRNKGFVKKWFACPVKGWFVAVESESTDTL